jgi:hypothetical protein
MDITNLFFTMGTGSFASGTGFSLTDGTSNEMPAAYRPATDPTSFGAGFTKFDFTQSASQDMLVTKPLSTLITNPSAILANIDLAILTSMNSTTGADVLIAFLAMTQAFITGYMSPKSTHPGYVKSGITGTTDRVFYLT